jgi:hypothetical protein
MTKKDFQMIAEIVGSLTWDDSPEVISHKATVVGARLAQTNPRFDLMRFVDAVKAVKS